MIYPSSLTYYQQQQNKELAKIWGLVGVCVLAIFLMIQGFAWLNGGDKDDNNVCSSCHKTFTNRADTKSIAYTSMCEPCYEDFKSEAILLYVQSKWLPVTKWK